MAEIFFEQPSGEDDDAPMLDQWLVQSGDHVQPGQTIAVVMVAKAAFEIEASVAGIIRLLIEAQEPLKSGEAIAVIDEEVA